MTDHPTSRHRRNWPSITGTPEQRASRGLSRLEDITRLISEWVWETDTDGRITYVSDRVNEVLGALPLQIVGKTFKEIGVFLNKNGDELELNWNNPFRDVLFRAEDNAGGEKLFLISGVPYYNPDTWKFEGVSGTAEDITERTQVEKDLREALERAEAANRAKSEFLATMSHELRTPLTSIKGSVGLLRGFMSKDLSEEGLSLLEMTSRNSETLLVLINDMLDYEKSITGMMEIDLSLFEIGELTYAITELNQGYAKSKGVKFECDLVPEKIWVRLNEHRYGQVLRNLLSNAAKFSDNSAVVNISVVRKNDRVRINVIDSGVGIPLEHQPTIFERFVQVDSSDSRQHMGTGLGLAICRSLTEAMGGTIDFISKPGTGSTFFVEFPVSDEPGSDGP